VASVVKDHLDVAVTTVFTHGHPAQRLVEASKGGHGAVRRHGSRFCQSALRGPCALPGPYPSQSRL
jgi:hypothetical protein